MRSEADIEQRLAQYRELVLRWNRRVALISRKTPIESLNRLISHSLEGEAVLPAGTEKVIDVGSGAGFPGVLIAIKRPGTQVELVERSEKKSIFLSEVKRTLDLDNATVIHESFEPAMLDVTVRTAITAMAVGDYVKLAESVAVRMKEGDGILLFIAEEVAVRMSKKAGLRLGKWKKLSGSDQTGVAWLEKGDTI